MGQAPKLQRNLVSKKVFVVYSDKNEEKLKYVILLTVVIPGK